MKKLLIVLSVIVLLGCSDKSVLLPEIQNATITEITDVSPAYIFYDETKPDSLELNKGNLIISTHWLVNVDKRLTLKQVIPSIIELQEKKRNSSHKNESARNYYTCNDTSIKNLGFIDFTDVVYVGGDEDVDLEVNSNYYNVFVLGNNKIEIVDPKNNSIKTNFTNLISELDKFEPSSLLVLSFLNEVRFQDYITIKSILLNAEIDNLKISNSEFISD
ncbi:hypothetical protein [uncultured Lacinutrix sp.]|uniref:hypothetical protein n=1 Tax=uncultured Lacinutrix sp. TaxID=574032 RepID=UPI002610EC72|nr:hypothetical protein [uncultured Lacinutrix sp.]